MVFNNVYFINGTAYAGKSTMVKLLAEKHSGILCEENYHDRYFPEPDKKEFPYLQYTRELEDWHDFIRRTPSEYDSLLLPGAMDIREAIEDGEVLSIIKLFGERKMIIGAISIAPILLVKNGIIGAKPFMARVNKEDSFEEGFSEEELSNMQGWDDNLKNPISGGYIISDNIITSVSYEFVRFALAFGKMLGIDIPSETFGIKK